MTAGDETRPAAPASERIKALEAELAHMTGRLRDLDHRIKNDLQLISSVFLFQVRRLPPGAERNLIRGVLARLNAVSAVHRRLKPLTDRLDAGELVRDIVADAAAENRREDIGVVFNVAPIEIPTRQGAALALIVGELTRNALIHAFPERGGLVTVGLDASANEVRLTIEDNGIGLPAPAKGFGTGLVDLLTQQLRGAFEIVDRSPGARATVRFPRAD